MPSPSAARLRAFVRRETRLAPVADHPAIRLHQAADVMALLQRAGTLLDQDDPPLPFWAFPWAGGLAIVRHLSEHPDLVAGRRVLDLATGSGLCAIAALQAGATAVEAVDIDPLAEAATELNARANGVRITFTRRDILGEPLPDGIEVVLAGDVAYEETMAGRMLAWLRRAADTGATMLVGDPGRAHFPGAAAGLVRVATYQVRTSRELEPADVREAVVWRFPEA
ncbi:MAG: 50S ribosomal protein L11 methyltransferase [Candidatus Limnocylindrales bacterium]